MQKISAFDLDNTLIKGNCSFLFGRYLSRHHLFTRKALFPVFLCKLGHQAGFFSISKLHDCAFRHLFFGHSAKTICEWAEGFLDAHLEQLIYPPAYQHLEAAKKAGHLTVILSSSPNFLVEPIAKRFGIAICEATQYGIDKHGNFCHIARLMLGEDKSRYIQELQQRIGCSKEHTWSYSDSHLDLPFLMAAGKPVGVNPNRKLYKICKENRWPMI